MVSVGQLIIEIEPAKKDCPLEWLKENGFAALVPIFEKEEMTEWSLFGSISIDILRKMNISMGQSIRLVEALKGTFYTFAACSTYF